MLPAPAVGTLCVLRVDPAVIFTISASKLSRMSGIVGYVGYGDTEKVLDVWFVPRLEYRGYDSAGIAIIDGEGNLDVRKRSGKLQMLREALEAEPVHAGTTGLGHTRWATHGGSTDENAHPHVSEDGKLSLIHNGIVEELCSTA